MQLTDELTSRYCRKLPLTFRYFRELPRKERRAIALLGWRRGNYFGYDTRFHMNWPEYWRHFCEMVGAGK